MIKSWLAISFLFVVASTSISATNVDEDSIKDSWNFNLSAINFGFLPTYEKDYNFSSTAIGNEIKNAQDINVIILKVYYPSIFFQFEVFNKKGPKLDKVIIAIDYYNTYHVNDVKNVKLLLQKDMMDMDANDTSTRMSDPFQYFNIFNASLFIEFEEQPDTASKLSAQFRKLGDIIHKSILCIKPIANIKIADVIKELRTQPLDDKINDFSKLPVTIVVDLKDVKNKKLEILEQLNFLTKVTIMLHEPQDNEDVEKWIRVFGTSHVYVDRSLMPVLVIPTLPKNYWNPDLTLVNFYTAHFNIEALREILNTTEEYVVIEIRVFSDSQGTLKQDNEGGLILNPILKGIINRNKRVKNNALKMGVKLIFPKGVLEGVESLSELNHTLEQFDAPLFVEFDDSDDLRNDIAKLGKKNIAKSIVSIKWTRRQNHTEIVDYVKSMLTESKIDPSKLAVTIEVDVDRSLKERNEILEFLKDDTTTVTITSKNEQHPEIEREIRRVFGALRAYKNFNLKRTISINECPKGKKCEECTAKSSNDSGKVVASAAMIVACILMVFKGI